MLLGTLAKPLVGLAAGLFLLLGQAPVGAASLGDALDRPDLTWTTGGDAEWFPQSVVTHDGADAARCGNLTAAGQASWIETTVTGRVSLVYWWKLSADPSWSTLLLQTNNAGWFWYYGERDWRPDAVAFAGGTNKVRWTYTTPQTDPTNWAGNAAWLDDVLVTNITNLKPVFVVEPPASLLLPEHAYAWTNLTALPVGDIPMSLQWQRDGTNLPAGGYFYDVNSAHLSLFPYSQASSGGAMALVASNQWGVTTSAVCSVSIVPSQPLIPPHEPADRVMSRGGYFNLWAAAYGTPPFGFQWFTNGIPVPGATNQYYAFYPVDFDHAGFYHYVATNAYGSATSRVAHLTVSTDPPVIVSQPTPEVQEVAPGSYVSIYSQAAGPEWLFYSWRKVGFADELGTWQWLTIYDAEPTNSGLYHLIVSNFSGAVTSRVSVLAVEPVTALAVAVDAPELTVTNHASWWQAWTADVAETNTHDGFCAARSPVIGDWDSASFSALVTGPTNVSFWWRISAATGAFLEVAVDGAVTNSISGETSWQQQSLEVPGGEHSVTWTFRKEGAGTAGADAAWVDQLVLGGAGPGSGGSHVLVAHYPFDDAGFLGQDTSGRDHHIMGSSSWGLPLHEFENDGISGPGAVRFYGHSSLAPPTNVLAALAGSFTVSAWLKTTQAVGNEGDGGPSGAGVISALMGYNTDSTLPISITGGKAAFWTGSSEPPVDDTLHSVSYVNTGTYVHVAVTRDQDTGQKRLYVNGVLEGTSTGSVRPFTNATALFDLNLGSAWLAYSGLLDDVQFYSGVLDATNIAFLHEHPGETVPDSAGPSLGEALNAPQLTWTTGGVGEWFGQSIVTHDGVAAAQSGVTGDSGENTLGTLVNGPGLLSFWWKVSSEMFGDALELWVDGSRVASISGDQDWAQYSLNLASGPHSVSWAYVKNGALADGADAGWVDQVSLAQPATADLDLRVIRQSDDGANEHYLLFPQLYSVTPDRITKHLVQSPNAYFQGAIGGEWSSSSRWMYTLQSLIEECTNGVWTLCINKGDPSEQRFTFRVSIQGLTTNILGPVTIHSPAQDSTGVPPQPAYHWSGPTNLPLLYAYVYSLEGGNSGSASLSGSATNWPGAPALSAGTNRLSLYYYLYGATNAAFTMPVDGSLTPLAAWHPSSTLSSGGSSRFVVGSSGAGSLLSPALVGDGLEFGFQSQAGRAHRIEGRTNLTSGAWQTLTNFTGDGLLWRFTFPTANPPTHFFRARTD